MRAVAVANQGLIAFRRGKPLEGISRYREAIESFQRVGQGLMVLSAQTYLCREAARAGLPEAPQMVEALRNSVKNSHISSIKKVFKNAEDFLLARKVVSDNQSQ